MPCPKFATYTVRLRGLISDVPSKLWLGEEQRPSVQVFSLFGVVNILRKAFYFHCEIICIFLLREDIETRHKVDHLHLNYLSKIEITHLLK